MEHFSDHNSGIVRYTFIKNGVYYFRRKVPKDLCAYYASHFITFSLKTRGLRTAEARAIRINHQLESVWFQLRLNENLFGKIAPMNVGVMNPKTFIKTNDPNPPLLSQVLEQYISLKAEGAGTCFEAMARRTVGYFISIAGDRPINNYKRADAIAFREWLIQRRMAGSTVKRITGAVKAVFGFGYTEHAINTTHPFIGLLIDKDRGTKSRLPIPVANIRSIQNECVALDDETRHLVALIADTGLRLAEAVGALKSDVILTNGKPSVLIIRPHPHRRLKTKSSERRIPLVGSSYWAISKRLAKNGNVLFPKYCQPPKTNANSASAALNKWLKPRVPRGCSIHSFRHSLRDRLREVECPSDLLDAIGGWSIIGVGQSYGRGYSVEIMRKYLSKIVL